MTSKIEGWSNRQKDTGWGYAFAHLLPFVLIYYAITRRNLMLIKIYYMKPIMEDANSQKIKSTTHLYLLIHQ